MSLPKEWHKTFRRWFVYSKVRIQEDEKYCPVCNGYGQDVNGKYCGPCKGKGKVDWVRRITQAKPHVTTYIGIQFVAQTKEDFYQVVEGVPAKSKEAVVLQIADKKYTTTWEKFFKAFGAKNLIKDLQKQDLVRERRWIG